MKYFFSLFSHFTLFNPFSFFSSFSQFAHFSRFSQLSFFSFFSIFITFADLNADFVVKLETTNQLHPIEISPITSQGSKFSQDYIKELDGIFLFDFNHNAVTVVVKDGKNESIYQLHATIKGNEIIAKLKNIAGAEEIEIGPMLLSGYLAEDRRVLHKISDVICEEGFGVKGIASTRILYTLRFFDNGVEKSDVWESDYDGANAQQLTRHGGYCVTPAYVAVERGKLPTHFIYVSYKTGQPKIYLASLKDGRGDHLLSLSGNQLMPTISRQYDYMAFISDTTGNPDLFLQAFNPKKGITGKPRHLFTAPLATQGTPTFSPDGKKIAFVTNKAGSPRIYSMEIPPAGAPLSSLKLTLLTKFNTENTAPSWSPDGSMIAYCAKSDGVRQIWVYDFKTGQEKQLTSGSGNKENPTWAPNSLSIMYNTTDTKKCELYMIDIKGLKSTKISSGPGDKRFPSWRV